MNCSKYFRPRRDARLRMMLAVYCDTCPAVLAHRSVTMLPTRSRRCDDSTAALLVRCQMCVKLLSSSYRVSRLVCVEATCTYDGKSANANGTEPQYARPLPPSSSTRQDVYGNRWTTVTCTSEPASNTHCTFEKKSSSNCLLLRMLSPSPQSAPTQQTGSG